LNEQKRIADKLDTVLTRVDAVNTRLARVAPLLKRLRQSVLAAATSGRLTDDWRIERNLPEWTSDCVGNLVKRVEAGLNVRCIERPPVNDERGLVKISAVTWGRFDEAQSKTLPASTEVQESVRIKVGDFLISRANTLELVGACVIVHEVNRRLYLSDKVLRLQLSDQLKPWLLIVLRSDIGRKQIEALASGNQLSMRNLSQSNLKAIRVPLPSSAEVTEIVRRVETLFAFADRLEARLQAAQTAADRLTPSLLSKAFRGELVPQDPNDEHASELLKQLAAAPATLTRKRRSKTTS
jgi:type I restriction enzyme S subunit